jgi:hypothetical protein
VCLLQQIPSNIGIRYSLSSVITISNTILQLQEISSKWHNADGAEVAAALVHSNQLMRNQDFSGQIHLLVTGQLSDKAWLRVWSCWDVLSSPIF